MGNKIAGGAKLGLISISKSIEPEVIKPTIEPKTSGTSIAFTYVNKFLVKIPPFYICIFIKLKIYAL